MITENELALERYNAVWANQPELCARLYKAATKNTTAKYGVAIQEHVLRLMGNTSSKMLNRIHVSKAVSLWVKFMIEEHI